MNFTDLLSENEFSKIREFTGMATQPQIPSPTGVTPVTQPTTAQPLQQTNPAQAAQMIKQRNDQKKQIQDQIAQKTKEIQDLRKQLMELG